MHFIFSLTWAHIFAIDSIKRDVTWFALSHHMDLKASSLILYRSDFSTVWGEQFSTSQV